MYVVAYSLVIFVWGFLDVFSFKLFGFDLLFIVIPIVRFCNCSRFCCTFLFVPSSFAIILMGKRELVALLSLPSWCLVIVVWLFLAVPLVSLQCVIVVFPDHTHDFSPSCGCCCCISFS